MYAHDTEIRTCWLNMHDIYRGLVIIWGLASVCWVWSALGARADTARAQTNLGSDWLVPSAVTFLRAASHTTMLKL